ncbi:unnamed protein product [Prorocentrum cordatum]|uniref:Helix-hairpin-helix DNA-binding motif class 1 domain-containing protein n=1 Tax=Prorocentrum cordatum TaxID=2364126 RepID=A0ABN9W2D1_9DINO|nr:unnamed protein product [Polarella glacialis]
MRGTWSPRGPSTHESSPPRSCWQPSRRRAGPRGARVAGGAGPRGARGAGGAGPRGPRLGLCGLGAPDGVALRISGGWQGAPSSAGARRRGARVLRGRPSAASQVWWERCHHSAMWAATASWERLAAREPHAALVATWERCQGGAARATAASWERLPQRWQAALVAAWERCQRGAARATAASWERLPQRWQAALVAGAAWASERLPAGGQPAVVALAGVLALSALWAARPRRALGGAAGAPPAGEADGAHAQGASRAKPQRRSRADSPGPAAAAVAPQQDNQTKVDAASSSKPAAAKLEGQAVARKVAMAPTPSRRHSAPQRADSPAPSLPPTSTELSLLAVLNHGSHEDLLSLKGIGDKTARAIMKYRENGEIHRLDELVKSGTVHRFSIQTLIRSAA